MIPCLDPRPSRPLPNRQPRRGLPGLVSTSTETESSIRSRCRPTQLGFPDPARDYYAVELNAGRRFADNWMLEASYVWSHSYGNYGGLVKADIGQISAGITQDFDFPGMMDNASGDLPNDRRHFGRIYGAYAWPWGLGVGGTLFVQSGRPINSFGYHPTEPSPANYNPSCFYTLGEPTPRGSLGRTETVWWLDLTVRYDWTWGENEPLCQDRRVQRIQQSERHERRGDRRDTSKERRTSTGASRSSTRIRAAFASASG